MEKNKPQALAGEGLDGVTLAQERNTGKQKSLKEMNTPVVDGKDIAKGSFPATYDYMLRDVAEEYDEDILQPLEEAGEPLPIPCEMAGRLLQRVVANIAAHNAGADKSLKWPVPKSLPPALVAWCMARRGDAKLLRLSNRDLVPAVYLPDKGVYSTRESDLHTVTRLYNWVTNGFEFGEVLRCLADEAETVELSDQRRYTPFDNGVYDWQARDMLPFDPSLVFTSKLGVPLDLNAAKPGGLTHEELFLEWADGDAELAEALLAVVCMVLRPALSWDRMVMLYAPSGSNGKGTFLQILKNIAGEAAMPSSLGQFCSRFGQVGVEHARLVYGDENNVRGFVEVAEAVKAFVTHDTLHVEVKCRTGYDVRPYGVMVQCLNEQLRSNDKSESFYRRVFPIPFNARFTGQGKDTSIKEELVGDPGFLAWLVRCAVEADVTPEAFEMPKACQELLDEFKVFNDPVRDFFFDVVCDRAVWDLLPWTFLYDLYKPWLQATNPTAKPIGRNKFISELREIAKESDEWVETEGKVKRSTRMDEPETMIAEYSLGYPWYNGAYQGRDMVRRSKCNSFVNSYRGLLRVGASIEEPPADDEEDGGDGAPLAGSDT